MVEFIVFPRRLGDSAEMLEFIVFPLGLGDLASNRAAPMVWMLKPPTAMDVAVVSWETPRHL